MKTILVVNQSRYYSGSEISIKELFETINLDLNIIWLLDNNSKLNGLIKGRIIKYKFVQLELKKRYILLIPLIIDFVFFLKQNVYILYLVKRHSIDICYFNRFKSLISCVIVLLNKRLKKVVHIRDNIRFKRISSFILSYVEYVISISEFISNQLYYQGDKVKIIYSGVRVEKTNIIEYEFRTNNQFTIGYINQITPWKNYYDFIEVANMLVKTNPNIRILVVGDSLSQKDKKYKEAVIKKFEKSSFYKNLEHISFSDDMNRIYLEIDLLVHTAVNEPFGRVLIEAMSKSIPVVGYNSGGPSEIILDGVTGYLVQQGDTNKMYDKITDLILNNKKRIEMAKNSQKRVLEKFNIINHAKKVEMILNSI